MKSNREVYIVDDSADHRFILQTIFAERLPQYSVKLFESGEQLYQHLILQVSGNYSGRQPGLIVLDLKMPRISGLELLKLLRRSPDNEKINWKMIPIVMLSSFDHPSDIMACRQEGANSFFKRPDSLEQMHSLLQTICGYWLGFHRMPAF